MSLPSSCSSACKAFDVDVADAGEPALGMKQPGSLAAHAAGRARDENGFASARLAGHGIPPSFRCQKFTRRLIAPSTTQVHAGREARDRAGQEHGGIGDFLRRRHAAGGIAFDGALVHVGHVLLDHLPDPALEIDGAGRDHIGADAGLGILAGEALGLMDQRGLDRPIGACAVGLGGRDRGDQDEGGVAPGFGRSLEERLGGIEGMDGPEHVEPEVLLPGLRRIALGHGAGIGDQDVDPAEFLAGAPRSSR